MDRDLSGPPMYKNRLQHITQKSGLPLPEYIHENEGFQHAPKFRVRVLVNGKYFASTRTFSRIIEAEQDAAKSALEHVTETVNDEGLPPSIVIQGSNSYKSILNEFSVKRNIKTAEYKTGNITEGETRPVFRSSLSFDGKVYQGEVSKSKKEAEQMAARAAILSLLESDSGVLRQIINSKNKTHDIFKAEHSHSGSNLPIVLIPDVAAVKPIDIVPSTANLNPVSIMINSSRENKRKPKTENQAQKRKRVHFKR